MSFKIWQDINKILAHVNKESERWTKDTGLQKHLQRDHFKETFRSASMLSVAGCYGSCNIATRVYHDCHNDFSNSIDQVGQNMAVLSRKIVLYVRESEKLVNIQTQKRGFPLIDTGRFFGSLLRSPAANPTAGIPISCYQDLTIETRK
jgi:hypothetical protein